MEEGKIIINIVGTCDDEKEAIIVEGTIEKRNASDKETVLVLANVINHVFGQSNCPKEYLWKKLKREYKNLQ